MKIFNAFCILTGIVLIAVLISRVGLERLTHDLFLLGWGVMPILLLEGLAYIFHTLGWQQCLSEPYRSFSLIRLFWIMMAGYSINYITPTAGLGGEVTKSSLLSLNHRSSEAVTGVIIDKLSLAVSQLICITVGSIFIFWFVDMPKGLRLSLLTGSILLGMGITGFFIIQKKGKLGSLARWLVTKGIGGQALVNFAESITKIDTGLKFFYKDRPHGLPYSILWHLAGLSCGIMQSYCFLFFLTDKPTVGLAAGIWILTIWIEMIGFAIPTNIGVVEATQVFVFNILGLDTGLGLAYGVTLRLEQIFWALFGLVVYAIYMFTSAQDKKPQPVQQLKLPLR